MPFEKENTLGGRNKGSMNKNTSKVRDAFAKLLTDNLPQLKKDLNSLEPKDRVRLLLDLSKYVIPQLKSTEVEYGERTRELLKYTPKELKDKLKDLLKIV